jgi:two-component system phosphate regulon response regulator OmpR
VEGFHILIIDDDSEIRLLLSEILIKNKFIISTVSSVNEARNLMSLFLFDLLILDVMMPGESGIDFLQKIDRVTPPILMLSALGDVDDRINGLEHGAADYLSKPFEVKELILRIKNLLSHNNPSHDIIKFGDYEFDIRKKCLLYKKQNIHLTSNEKILLTLLAQKCGEIISRDEVANAIGGELSTRAVDAQVARLRIKIEINPKSPYYLHTVRNKGYVLRGS